MEWDKKFSMNYERIYRECFTDEQTNLHADFVSKFVPQNGSILDMPCGAGRVSIALAKRSFRVKGIDLYNIPQVLKRSESANGKSLDLTFETGDMRTYSNPSEKFDTSISLFSSFGYFEHESNVDTLERLVEATKRGGVIIIDTSNPVRTLLEMSKNNWELKSTERGYPSTTTFDPLTALQSFSFTIDDETVTARMRHYFLPEFRDLFTSMSCKIEAVHGNFKREPYNPESSKRMILVARKD